MFEELLKERNENTFHDTTTMNNGKNQKVDMDTPTELKISQAQPRVSICCTAYNKELYIKDAIESFLAQKTDFPIEMIMG